MHFFVQYYTIDSEIQNVSVLQKYKMLTNFSSIYIYIYIYVLWDTFQNII